MGKKNRGEKFILFLEEGLLGASESTLENLGGGTMGRTS